MAQQRQQRRRGGGGVLRLVAVLLLLSSLCCIARADAVAAPSASLVAVAVAVAVGAAPASDSQHGVATAMENALAQEVASTAAADQEEGDGAVVLERVAMESTEDYQGPGANSRHEPHP